MLFFDAVRFARAFDQAFGQVADRLFVAKARRVVKAGNLGQLGCFAPDLLDELPRDTRLGVLALDVPLARRKLEHGLVDRGPVLADHQDALAVRLERHRAHRTGVPNHLTLEGESVRPDEGAGHDPKETPVVPWSLPDPAERVGLGTLSRRH